MKTADKERAHKKGSEGRYGPGLTINERLFCYAYTQRKSDTFQNPARSHKEAGYEVSLSTSHASEGRKVLERPKVKAEIARLEALWIDAEATQIKEDVKSMKVTREAIRDRFWELANLSLEDTKGNASAQVSANKELAEIYGMKVSLTADVTKLLQEFESRSAEDLLHFFKHGEFPSKGGSGGSSE